MALYQSENTRTGIAVSTMEFCVYKCELRHYDSRKSVPAWLSMGGPLDAPDYLPSGHLESNDGDSQIMTVERPGRFSTAQENEYNDLMNYLHPQQ